MPTALTALMTAYDIYANSVHSIMREQTFRCVAGGRGAGGGRFYESWNTTTRVTNGSTSVSKEVPRTLRQK